ncbi:MAG: class I SAM-dependent methyltransferase [Myxococcota bacterium]
MQVYDEIGSGYAPVRRADPRIRQAITDGLGTASRVVNVGAGPGSYEPRDRRVVAVEPSWDMIRQRPAHASPCIRAAAEALPFPDDTFDAALAVLTIHHWSNLRHGLREMRRVAPRRVVLFTWDPAYANAIWMNTHYLPEAAALDVRRFPTMEAITHALPGARVDVVPIPHDCTDGFYGAYWRRPEAYLQPEVRAGISVLRMLPNDVVAAGLKRLADDLRSGAWHARLGALLQRETLDLGYRLVVVGQ